MKKAFGNLIHNSTLWRIIGTIIALSLIVYLLQQQGWTEIKYSITKISAWRFGLAFCLMIVSRFLVAARWHSLLRSVGVRITFWRSLTITFAGLFATNFLPTTVGGDMVRLAGGIKYKYDTAIVTGSLIVDRLVGMAAMAVMLPFALPYVTPVLLANRQLPSLPASITLSCAVDAPHSFWKKIQDQARKIARSLLDALALWLKQPASLFVAVVITWAHMLCLFLIFDLLLRGMGEDLPLWGIAGLYSLAYFITLLPISINGYGVQELSMTVIFSRLGGVSLANSLTMALLFRTLMMIASLPGALTIPGLLSPEKSHPAGS